MITYQMYDIIILIISLSLITAVLFVYHKDRCYKDPLIQRLREDLIRIDPRTSKLSFYASDESFTEDKERVFLCLKDNSGQYYPYNFILMVALHELAHAFTEVIDKNHVTPEFKNMFTMLKLKAQQLGLYDPDGPIVTDYCCKNCSINQHAPIKT